MLPLSDELATQRRSYSYVKLAMNTHEDRGTGPLTELFMRPAMHGWR
jgi:hypothetical protein